MEEYEQKKSNKEITSTIIAFVVIGVILFITFQVEQNVGPIPALATLIVLGAIVIGIAVAINNNEATR